MKINVLPTEIANMIAAGEVVERPGSVVKELVENCIDAGATSITVEIKKGGVPYIRVSDNGSGIEADDIITAFKRHATSKITKASDLDAIGTLGFRGEALASIAAVARVEVFSKTKNSDIGRCVTVEAGEVLENEEAGCPDGTTMIVRNLFFNTPARMKFLKNDATEASYVSDIINKLVLSHPEISFQYINNGKTVLSSGGDGKLLSSIYTVFGRDYAKNMIEVFYEEPGFRVRGYVGNSRLARKDRRHQLFFVNTRNIMSKIMSAAVSEAYKSTVMVGHFPVCVLKVEVDPKIVDVNVHPAKIEVRFADDKQVYNMLYWAVKNALTDKKFVPEIEVKSTIGGKTADGGMVKNAPSYEDAKQLEINLLRGAYVEPSPAGKVEDTPKERPAAAENKVAVGQKDNESTVKQVEEPEGKADTSGTFFTSPDDLYEGEGESSRDVSRFSHLSAERHRVDVVQRNASSNIPAEDKPVGEKTRKAEESAAKLVADVDFKLVGQAFGTFILVQMDNDLLVIDQHAAHERIYFEELLEEFDSQEVASQLMLLPVTMILSPMELDTALKGKEFFCKLGFEIDDFGQNSIVIRSTPGTMDEQDIKDCVSRIITMLTEHKNNYVRELYEEALHMVACKRALKGNSVLSEKEQKSLAEQVLALGEGINTCPHGRPIMIKMSKYSLEKQFKRIV